MEISKAATRRQQMLKAHAESKPTNHKPTRDQLKSQLTVWATPIRGTHEQEFDIFLSCADDGNGGDTTNNGRPLPTFAKWLAR